MVVTGGARCSSRNYIRISNAIRRQTTACVTERLHTSVSNSNITGDGSDNFKINESEYSGSGPRDSKFYIKVFPYSKKRRVMSPDFQFEAFKSLSENRKISVDFGESHPRFFTSLRLDGQNRFDSSIQSRAGSGNPSLFPSLNIPRKTSSNDLFTIWVGNCAENFCYADELDCANLARTRSQSRSVLRRFFDSKSKQNDFDRTGGNRLSNFSTTRMGSQQREVSSSTSESNRVFGLNVGSVAKSQISPSTKNSEAASYHVSISTVQESDPAGGSVSSRSAKFCSTSNPSGTSQLQTPAKPLQFDFKATAKYSSRFAGESDRRTSVVASKLSKGEQSAPAEYYSFFNDRCFRSRLGRRVRRLSHEWKLGTRRRALSLQPERNVDDSQMLNRVRSVSMSFDPDSTMRQQIGVSLPSERGGYEIENVNDPYISNNGDNSQFRHSYFGSSHPGKIQCNSGSSVSIKCVAGMASKSFGDRDSVQEVGCPGGRFVCIPHGTRSRQICDTGSPRPGSLETQRVRSGMGFQTSVGFPSPKPRSQSTHAVESSERDVSNCSSSVATGVLESGLEGKGDCPTLHSSQPRQGVSRHVDGPTATQGSGTDARSLEMWGWTSSLTTWSEEQKKLLNASWRTSTIGVYKPIWNRWVAWCAEINVDFCNPSPSDLAKYLADLHLKHKLAYKTILTHKSVISTLSNVDRNDRLSSHLLVKKILKSIALQTSTRRRSAIIWDCQVLETWLSKFKTKNLNLYEISRLCAVILLLCSGRRVHDLTLLSVSSENCIVSDNDIIFWPNFGSKTDSATHMQSGWRLLQNQQSSSLDPVYMIKKLIEAGTDRRRLAPTHSLFVTACGVPKPATKTIIANWVKSVLKDAGINASPGSIRSAVASRSWLDNEPLDTIMARANWKSSNTFLKFYRKEVRSSNVKYASKDSLRNQFQPV